jgi:hypothetical protein
MRLLLSSTSSVTTYEPGTVNVHVTVVPVASKTPSPVKSQSVRTIVAFWLAVEVEVNVTGWPVTGAIGL